MLKSIYRIIALAIISILFTSTINAQCSGVCSPNLYEEFNYPANTAIRAAVGGSGWAAGWDVQNDSANVPGYSINSSSLSYSTLKTFNNKLSGGTAFLTIGRYLNTSTATNAPFANFVDSASLIGKKGTTLYFSILLNKKVTTSTNTQQVRAMLHKGSTAAWSVSNTGTVGIGYFGSASETSGTKFWSLQIEGTTFKTSVRVATDTAALLVLKMEFLTNYTTKYSLFINPATIGSAGEPATPTLTQTVSKLMDFKALALRLGDAAAQGEADEIRIATTYQCATPDASTAVNQLPVASFSNNISSGTAPFSVSFNGSASSDPDGTIASYNWSCSDGTTATGATPNIVFKNQGAIVVTLTVTDNCGSVNSTSSTILVNNSNGFFSCFATPRLSKLGNCDSTTGGGEIIFTGGTSYSLFNKKTNATTNQSSGTFSNLNAGFYRIAVAGNLGCKDTFNLQVPISHECAGQARGNLMKMGVNIEPLDYFNQCATFKDYMLSSGNFFTDSTNGIGAFDTKVMNQVPVDSNGYPLQIPVTTTIGQQRVRKLLSSTTKHLPLGNYALFYDGTGTLSIAGGTTTSNQPNKMLITITGTGNVWLDISASSSTDHVRNIRLVRIKDTATYTTQPFDEKFLNILCPFSCIRFMQIQNTIGNGNTVWSGRTIPTFHSQSTLATVNKGIAYEHICKLANTTGKDIWICVPHLVDDNYITEMAKLFKAKLNPQIKVFLEFSNEVWNFGYTETMDVYNAGPQNITNARRYALRCANMFNIWKSVWGNDFSRVVRVAGTQAVNNSNGQELMAELKDNFDVLAPALYFNYTKDASCYANLKSLGTAATTHDILNCAKNDFLTSWASVAQNNKDAWMYGKGVVHYEWGQGLTSDGKIETFQDSTYAAQITTEMVALYQQALDSMKHWNTDQINPYELTGERQSKFGSWGHLEYVDQDTTTEPAPKISVLLKNMNPAVQGTCLFPGVPITAVANTNGNISPAGITTVGLNANQTYTITPNTGFCIQDVLVDGNSVGAVASFTFTNIVATHTISVSYIAQVTPTVSIAASANNVCNGTSITFTATPVNSGPSPVYQWKLNGNNVGVNATTFTISSLQNNDVISCVMTANNVCQTTATATSNGLTLAVGSTVTPSVSISSTSTSFCTGTSATFTATPTNGGSSPSYQWKNNGNNIGTNSATLILNAANVANADVITCVMTANNTCQTTATANSNGLTLAVGSTVTPSVSIASTSTSFCTGSSSTFTATPTNGGSTPSYQWKNNGNNIGTNSATLILNVANVTNGDVITCVMTANNVCQTTATATSNGLLLTVGSTVNPSVIISGASTVCSGSNTTYTAQATNGGSSPTFQWLKNGNNVGSASSIQFDGGTLSTNDVISCLLTANNTCQTTATANSNTITLNVIPSPVLGTSSSVSIFCTLGCIKTIYNTNTANGGLWVSSNPSIASVATASNGASGAITANANGTASITYTKTGTNGCVSTSNAVMVTVAAVTTPEAISGTNSICIGNTTSLSTSSTGGVWSSSNNKGTISNGGVYTGINGGAGEARYTVTNGSGCSAYASYAVTVNNYPNIPTINYVPGTVNPQYGAPAGSFCSNKTFTVVGTPTGGVWSKTGVINVTSPAGVVSTGSTLGVGSLTYTITVNGCSSSRTISGNVVACVARGVSMSNEQLVNSSEFTMFPNPAKSVIHLQVDKLIGAGSIVITDLYGKTVKNQNLSMGTNTVDIANLSKGMYFFSTITNEGKATKKLVVE